MRATEVGDNSGGRAGAVQSRPLSARLTSLGSLLSAALPPALTIRVSQLHFQFALSSYLHFKLHYVVKG